MNYSNVSSKAAIYARTASVHQGNAITVQLKSLTREAASQGLEVVGVYLDVGCSGSSLRTCPQLRKLLEGAKAGRFRHLLALDLSRLSRGPELAEIVAELRRCGVALHCGKVQMLA